MNQNLSGQRIAILVADGFEQVEFTKPKKALEEAGAATEVVSLKPGKIQGFNHAEPADSFDVDRPVAEANIDDYDALLLPGGIINPDQLRGNEHAVAFAQTFATAGKPIFAICHGPQLLITAGVVNGREMTSYHTVRVDLVNAGAQWVDKPVVIDGSMITSRNPDDIPEFNKAMIQMLVERSPVERRG